jgi:hypothetical protein
MKIAIVASLLASASAFAPAQQTAKKTSLAAAAKGAAKSAKGFENELGVQEPVSKQTSARSSCAGIYLCQASFCV